MPKGNQRNVDNRPSWIAQQEDTRKVKFREGEDEDAESRRKKGRLWVLKADIMVSANTPVTPPMPIDVDNGLPGIELWFGSDSASEVAFICHMDTCAAMNTGNLLVHQWLMTTYPHIVAEYIQYDDIKPFEPLQLHCAINDLEKMESLHGKLTAVVRYRLRHTQNGKPAVISFGLGAGIEVNSIVGLPTIKAWNSVFNFSSDELVATGINSRFPLIFESTKHGLPPGIAFSASDFVRPLQGSSSSATALLTNIDSSASPLALKHTPSPAPNTPTCVVTQTDTNGCVRRFADVSHIE